jgi:hypothetical protein
MRFKKLIRLFEDGNVCVCGLRGRGKDLLMSNVVCRRNLDYVSNIDYGGKHHFFNYDELDCGENTYVDFINGTVNYYEYPYPDGTDVYLSDAGIYFPSQFCSELNRKFPYMSVFQAISRHVGDCNFHFNAQNLNRVWDKIREQSDIYILCRRCIYIRGFVIQFITVYDKYDSAVARMKPLRLPAPMFSNKETRMMRKIQIANFEAAHGSVVNRILVYKNKSKYNTRQFNEILRKGSVQSEK